MNSQMLDIIQSMQIGYDATFELNDFGEPRIRSNAETLKDILLFILFSKPGQYPSLPTIGYDIESKLYSFYDEINESDIIEALCSQCEVLRDYFNDNTILIKKDMYKGQPALLIDIFIEETFPDGYMKDSVSNPNKYLIGITFDEMHKMVYDISTRKGE